MARRWHPLLVVATLVVALAACTGPPGGTSGSVPASTGAASAPDVSGRVHAGPTCPVSQPGDPACADRAVAGAVLVVTSKAGAEVTRATSGADGTFRIALPPGDYVLVPQPVAGLLGTAQPIPFQVPGDGTAPAAVDVAYDTGIR